MTGVVIDKLLIDPAKSAEENFFAAVIGANATKGIVPAMMIHSKPFVWSSPTDDWRNTEVILTAQSGFHLAGTQHVYYRRDPLNVLGAQFTYANEAGSTLDQLLAYVAGQLKLVLSDVKFNVYSLPTPAAGEDTVTIQLQAIDDSLLYTGSVSIVITGLRQGDVRLEEDGSVRLNEDGTTRFQDVA